MALVIYAKTVLMKLCCAKPDSELNEEQISKSWMICSMPAWVSFLLVVPLAIFAAPWAALGGGMSGHSGNAPECGDMIIAIALELPLWYVPLLNLAVIPSSYALLSARGLAKSGWAPAFAFFAVTFVEYFIVFGAYCVWIAPSQAGEFDKPVELNSPARYGLIDRSGNLIALMKYKYLKDMHGGLAAFEDGFNRWGYIDSTGKEVIPAQYAQADDFSQGRARVTKFGLFAKHTGTIDRLGKFTEIENTIVKASAETPSVSALKPVQSEGKWGFVDSYGRFVVHPSFESVKAFYQGTAAVKVDGRWGIVNQDGFMVIPASFRDASSFHEGVAVVAF